MINRVRWRARFFLSNQKEEIAAESIVRVWLEMRRKGDHAQYCAMGDLSSPTTALEEVVEISEGAVSFLHVGLIW